MKFTVFITGLCLVPLLGVATTQAQKAATKQIPLRITYQKHLPGTVRRQMPPGMVSRFSGSFRTGAGKPLTLINLYNAANAKHGYAPQQSFQLAIFQLKGKGRKAHYVCLQNIPINYTGWGWAPDKYGAQLLWANSRKKDQPVLEFDCISNGEYGPSGDNILMVFPKGFQAKPWVKTFNFGAWHASDTSGETNSFDEISDECWMRVKTQISLATDSESQPPPSVMQWDGEKFGAVK